MVVTNNRATVNCTKSEFDNNLISIDKVVGLTYNNNTITTGLTFTDSFEGQNGVSVTNCVIGEEMYTRTIKMRSFSDASIGVVLPNSAGNKVKLTASTSLNLVLKSDGRGEITLTYEDNGSVTVGFNPNSGYHFTGWTVLETGEKYDPTSDTKLTSGMTLVANFSR